MSDHDEQSHTHGHGQKEPEESNGKEKRRRKNGRRKKATLKLSPDTQELVFTDSEREQQQTINPDWRSVRRNKHQVRISPSASPQELHMWLQQGGWRYIAASAFLLLVVIVVLLVLNRTTTEQAVIPPEPPISEPLPADNTFIGDTGGDGDPPSEQGMPAEGSMPTENTLPVEGNPSPPALPDVQPSPSSEWIVVGTGNLGLRLRADHQTNSPVLATLQDGTRVQQVSEDFAGPDFVWRKVRSPDGIEGWVAVDWLEPAPSP